MPGNQELNSRAHPSEAGVAGDMMTFMINMEKAVFFDPVSEDRL